MTKLIAIIAGLSLGTLGVASAQMASSGEPANGAGTGTTTIDTVEAGTTTTETAETTTTTEDRPAVTGREPGEDVRGPCDEAEHANDPRCAGGATAAGGNETRARDRRREPGEDVRGPCDEAEH